MFVGYRKDEIIKWKIFLVVFFKFATLEKVSHFSSLKHCRFSLGSRGNVDKYIKQFTEIFTEEGRRAVKITHQVIGQKPVVTHTQPTTSAASAHSGVESAQAQSIISHATNLATSLAGEVCTIFKISCF